VDAIAAHEQVGPDARHGDTTHPIDELCPDPIALLTKAGQVVTGVNAIGAKPSQHGAVEDAE
jgi:hypothetical protein